VIVIDASIFVKLLKDEDDSDHARSFVDHMLAKGDGYLTPSLVLYETLSASLHVGVPLTTVGSLFEEFRALGLVIEEPNQADLTLAEAIARTQSPGGGYPTLFDSLYHAMAIERGGIFVTADARHVAKTARFGHATLLADWRPG
jgi:predicted nucleic acid-binding protein